MLARGGSSHAWAQQLPTSNDRLNGCEFIWDATETQYDWLVVIDDVSRKLNAPAERLACADEHTLLVTTEPSSITNYGSAFCEQFEHVLTSQPPEALKHQNRIYSHTGNLWFNGHNYKTLNNKPFPNKDTSLSTVCSTKQQKHTLHSKRYEFSHWLKDQLPELEIYGHGERHVEHKHESLDRFKFHLAIENHVGLHHWTEKLSDPFLSGCFPIYYGCTNLAEYFPEESYLQIDIFNRQDALMQIRELLKDESFYTSRIEALYEARKRVMNDYNLLFMIAELVEQHYRATRPSSNRPLFGRKQVRLRRPAEAINHLAWHFKRYVSNIG